MLNADDINHNNQLTHDLQIIPIEEYDDDTQDASAFSETAFDSDEDTIDHFSSKIYLMT